jgi:hypothetical protein
MGFPDHAVIVAPNEPRLASAPIAKGIEDHAVLFTAIAAAAAASRDGLALVQSDMRANRNPTRMTTLGRLAEKLADRLNCACPVCAAPGFGVVGTEPGLPCAWCGSPTHMQRSQILGCAGCEFREQRSRPDGLAEADPGHCANCNP